ncbi:hypothetical protein [Sphingomonas radiodurans]|uniref:hypothetical protein n=1 Tax=Sphingomonas radiodurans TaxID=2890321 RepID=UPI001E297538|nr:hypothetical protein [Sphingomonas radiodurans]WBH17910.1 hypothetical protein LLW23_07405 [Sphingomonas radiodurans]
MTSLRWLYVAGLALLVGAQLLLGANLWVLSALAAVAGAAVWPLSRGGWRISDGLYAIMCIYFGTASLVVKTLARQPVQSNLQVPDLSAGYLLAGFASISLGYLASQSLRQPLRFATRLRDITANPRNLSRFAAPVFLLGAIFYFLQTQFRALATNGGFEAGGFGGFGTFYPLLVLGAALQTALIAQRPRASRHKVVLGAMAAVILALTLADNTKRTLFDFLFVVTVTFLAFGVRLRWRWIVPPAIAAAVTIVYVVPAIQIVRAQADVRGLDRIAATLNVIAEQSYDPVALADQADRIATNYHLTYRDSYVYPLTWNSERFTMIQPIDLVARKLAERGTMGGAELLRDPAETLLPSLLMSKTLATAPDRIAWHYGFRASGSIARPVVGLIASSLAAFGLVGVLLLPGLTVAFTFVVLDGVGGRLVDNSWATFLFATTAFLAEREVSTTLSFFCRSFIFILLTGCVLLLLGQRKVRRSRATSVSSAPRLATNASPE